jgi:alpha-tubulin suppressor-like RCC1 family protein
MRRSATPFLAAVMVASLPACKGRFSLPPDARHVVAFSLADSFACSVMKDGSVRCWGSNDAGQLGDGTAVASAQSVRVVGIGSRATTVATGGRHACALTAEGDVYCWGANGAGEVGDSSRSSWALATRVAGVKARAIALGARHTCALTPAGDVVCWGARDAEQLGDAPSGGSCAGTTCTDAGGGGDVVTVLQGASALAAGGDATCAIGLDRRVRCWGKLPLHGPSGVAKVEGLADVVSVALSDTHLCAVRAWGGVTCLGKNDDGELGDGSFVDHSDLVDVAGLATQVATVAVGRGHTCALLRSESVHCWGANAHGQLSDGTRQRRNTPALVNGIFEVREIAAAGEGTCARMDDGAERCWGGIALPKTEGADVAVPTEVRW